MLFWMNLRYLLSYFLLFYYKIHSVTTTWPSSNSSNIQLLGIFENTSTRSETAKWSIHSQAMFKAAIVLSQKYNITINGKFIEWLSAETNGNAIDALSKTCQTLSISNVVGIVGPPSSREAHLIADFGKTIGIPVISYSITDPDLSDRRHYPNFYRIAPSDKSTAEVIVQLFMLYNWTSCILIYQNDDFGTSGDKIINEAFADHSLTVEYTITFDISTFRFRGDLKTLLMNSGTRIVILWVEPNYMTTIIQIALRSDVLGPQFTWILSSTISLNDFDKKYHENLVGLMAIEPLTGNLVNIPINKTLLDQAYEIWKQNELQSFPGENNVNYFALFAFDATWSLIQSLEKFCSRITNDSSSTSCVSFKESSFCFHRHFLFSDLLLHTITTTGFLGVSGPINFNFDVTDRINSSYFYVKNVQPVAQDLNFIPVLEYSGHGNWKTFQEINHIIWPGASLKHPTGRATLQGITLQIGFVGPIPFTITTNLIDENGQSVTQYTGYIHDLIELLQKEIGFIPNKTLALANRTYEGLVQAVVNGEYDILIGDITVTAKRRDLVGFSNAIFDNSLQIISRKKSDTDINLLSFLKPFSKNLWLLVLAICIYAGLLVCLIERKDNCTLQNRSTLSQITMSIWYSVGNIMGYGVDFHVSTAAGRLLTMGLYMLSLILVISYTANLASDLTILKTKYIISGINDIKSGKIQPHRVGIRTGSASEDYYLREISSGIRNFWPMKSQQELYNSLLDETIDISFMDTGMAEYVTNNIYCNLTLIGQDFEKGVFGIVTPKQWLYAKDLDVNILKLRERGELEKLREKWFRKKTCPDISLTSTAITVESMGGLFLIFALITFLSLLLFLWSKRIILKNYLFVLIGRK